MWKINKIVATRCHILRLKFTKFNFSAPPDLLAEFKGAYFLREGREGEERGREGGKGKGGKGKGGGRGGTPWFMFTPLT